MRPFECTQCLRHARVVKFLTILFCFQNVHIRPLELSDFFQSEQTNGKKEHEEVLRAVLQQENLD
jgi:hypothetical protein